MTNGLGEMELELEGFGEGEGEGEFESELEGEFEGEFESELEGEFESELEGEGEFEGEGFLGDVVGGLLGESEFEGEFESESEFEGPNPVNRIYPDAMMEHMGLAAMEAESEFEAAEHFLPLIPMVASKLLPLAAKALPKIAGKLLPRIARTITRATPRLTRSVSHLTRALHRNPQTRHLVRVVPSVARRTVASIVKRAARGRPVSPATATRILARQRRHVLGNPKIRRLALRRSRHMDHRFHRHGGFGLLPGVHGRAHRAGTGGWSPGRWVGGRWWPGYSGQSGWAPRARTVGFGAGAASSAGLPARFRAPGAARVAGARVCPTCGGMGAGRRSCCCCC
jgi:hypothetical protein